MQDLDAVVDGRDTNGHFGAYAAGLTNVEVSLVVEDTLLDREWAAASELGEPFSPRFDIVAFPCGG